MSALEEFLRDNPKLADEAYGAAMAGTLSKSFPCGTQRRYRSHRRWRRNCGAPKSDKCVMSGAEKQKKLKTPGKLLYATMDAQTHITIKPPYAHV